MCKQKRGEELTKLLLLFEETKDPKEQIVLLDSILEKGYTYNAEYKRPHLHPFMGEKVKISNELLNGLAAIRQSIQS